MMIGKIQGYQNLTFGKLRIADDSETTSTLNKIGPSNVNALRYTFAGLNDLSQDVMLSGWSAFDKKLLCVAFNDGSEKKTVTYDFTELDVSNEREVYKGLQEFTKIVEDCIEGLEPDGIDLRGEEPPDFEMERFGDYLVVVSEYMHPGKSQNESNQSDVDPKLLNMLI